MNPVKKLFCRSFQAVLRFVMPVLPYRAPRVLPRVQDIPQCLKEKKISHVLIVTDGFLHLSGMLEPLKKALNNGGIGYTIYDEVTPNPTILNVELARERYLADKNTPADEAAARLISEIRRMNKAMNIPETLPGIREADIPKLANYADREVNPLYPVPKLMDATELARFYYDVMEETK